MRSLARANDRQHSPKETNYSQEKENIMEYATLGNTGLQVSKLCLGTMTFGDGSGLFKALGAVGQAGADELIKASIDSGINFVDTADNYTEGESEKILGQSLKNLNIARKDVVIATKVYSRVGPGRNDVRASRGHIMDGVESCLLRLQTDHIDLYLRRILWQHSAAISQGAPPFFSSPCLVHSIHPERHLALLLLGGGGHSHGSRQAQGSPGPGESQRGSPSPQAGGDGKNCE
jgi:hypothetical protein